MKLVWSGVITIVSILIVGTILTMAISAGAANTRQAPYITATMDLGRSDIMQSFYAYTYPAMYNNVIRDLDSLYLYTGVSSDSVYKIVAKLSRAWVDTIKTNTVYFPGAIAVDTNKIAQFTITGMLDVDTIKGNCVDKGNFTVDGLINTDSIGTALTCASTLKVVSTTSVDSLYSTKGIKSGGPLYATTGNLSSAVTVDSLYSTKGIVAAHANINGLTAISGNKITFDSAKVAGGTVWKGLLYTTITYNPPSIGGPGDFDSTFSFAGATATSMVLVNPPAGFESGLTCRAWIPATDSIRIRISNYTASPVDPASGTWKAMLVKF